MKQPWELLREDVLAWKEGRTEDIKPTADNYLIALAVLARFINLEEDIKNDKMN